MTRTSCSMLVLPLVHSHQHGDFAATIRCPVRVAANSGGVGTVSGLALEGSKVSEAGAGTFSGLLLLNLLTKHCKSVVVDLTSRIFNWFIQNICDIFLRQPFDQGLMNDPLISVSSAYTLQQLARSESKKGTKLSNLEELY